MVSVAAAIFISFFQSKKTSNPSKDLPIVNDTVSSDTICANEDTVTVEIVGDVINNPKSEELREQEGVE